MVGLIQRSFSGGEVDSALLARSDTTRRVQGLKTCRNFLVTRTGSVQNRTGTQYLGTTKDSHDDIRLEEWNDGENAYVLEVGEYYIRLWTGGALLLTGSQSAWADATDYVPGDIVTSGGTYYYCVTTHTSASGTNDPATAASLDDFWYTLTAFGSSAVLELPTPYTQAQLAGLSFGQSAGVMTVTHESHPPQELLRGVETAWTFLPMEVKPSMSSPSVTAGASSGTAPGGGAGTGWDIRYMVTAVRSGTGEESLPGPDTANTVTDCAISDASAQSTTDDLSVTSTAHGLVNGSLIYVRVVETTSAARANENAVIALKDKVFQITKTSADAFTLDNTAGMLTFPAIADTGSWPSVQIDYAPAFRLYEDRQFPTQSSGKIDITIGAVDGAELYRIYRSAQKNGDDFTTFGFVEEVRGTTWRDEGQPADNDFGPARYRNPFRAGDFPRCTGFFQQRQFFGSSTEHPLKVWGSVTGDTHDFSTHTPTEDSDSLEFTIDGIRSAQIQSMASLGQLLIFATGAVWAVKGDSSGVVTPTAFNLEVLTYDGSTSLQPLLLGDSVLYIESRGSIVREVRFDSIQGGFSGFAGRDMTIFAPHLFDGYSVVDWAYGRVPHRVSWIVRSDGSLIGLTYLREQEILAWHRHDTGGTSGAFLQVATIPESSVDTPYFLVKRTIDGSDAYYMESLPSRTVGQAGVDDRLSSRFLDCAVMIDGTNATATTLTLTGGTTWAADETGLTLTASAGLFPGDASNVGEGYRLVGADGSEVEVVVTVDGSTTVQTVTLLTNAPASTQATATASWVAMTATVDSLDHLEGESVRLLADSTALGPYTVASGSVTTLARPYGIIHAGLAITGQIQTFDADLAQSVDSWMDRQKLISGATLMLRNTRGVRAGPSLDYLMPYDLLHTDTTTGLITDKRHVGVQGEWNDDGWLWIQQTAPLPAELLALVTHLKTGERS